MNYTPRREKLMLWRGVDHRSVCHRDFNQLGGHLGWAGMKHFCVSSRRPYLVTCAHIAYAHVPAQGANKRVPG